MKTLKSIFAFFMLGVRLTPSLWSLRRGKHKARKGFLGALRALGLPEDVSRQLTNIYPQVKYIDKSQLTYGKRN